MEQLHFIYSRHTNQLDKAIGIAQKLLDKTDQSPQVATFLAEDLIKSGRYKEGRAIAQDVLNNTKIVKRQLILRFLIISSYFLEGRCAEGEKELGGVVENYQGLQGINFKISDQELDFTGLKRLVDKSQISKSAKTTMNDLSGLLQGKVDENKILGMVSNFAKTTIKSTATKNRRLKHLVYALVPIAIIGPLIALYLTSNSPSPIFECPPSNTATLNHPVVKAMPLEGRKTYGMEIEDDVHRAYILNRDKTITIVDTCTDKVLNSILINASVIVPDVTHTVIRSNDPISFVSSFVYNPKLSFWSLLHGNVNFKDFVRGNVSDYKIYIVNEAANELYVHRPSFSKSDPTTTSILKVPANGDNRFIGIQIDKKLHKLFVADRNSSVYVIDTDKDNELPQKVNVLPKPNDIAVDPKKHILYVKYDDSKTISAINVNDSDLDNSQVVITLKYFPGAMAIDEHGALHFTVGSNLVDRAQTENGIYELKLPDDLFTAHAQNSSLPNNSPIEGTYKFKELKPSYVNFGLSLDEHGKGHDNGKGLEIMADSNFTYVMDNDTDSVTIIKNSNWGIEKTVQVGESPNNIAIDRIEKKMYVTSGEDILHPLVVIDLKQSSSDLRVGNQPSGIAVDPVSHVVYVANFGSNDITIVQENGNNTYSSQTVSLDNQTVRTYNHTDDRTDLTNDYSPASNQVNSSIEYNPSSLAVNPKTHMVYVANFGDNSISVINGSKDKNEIIWKIPVGKNPSSIAVDINSDTVYVS